MPIHALPNQVCIRRSYAFGVKAVIPLLVFLLLLGFSPCALAQEQSTILLEPTVGGLFKIHATIAGRPGVFLFDSGSGFSNISPEFATEIGCHPWGQITGFRMTGERLDMQHCDHVAFNLAGRWFAASTVGVFDLSKYLPNQVGHIDGTIALDLFENEAFTLSCGGHVLRLLDHKALAVQSAGARGMPIHVVRDAEGLALTVNLPLDTLAGTAWFELDSGNTSSRILVNKPLAPLFGLPARPNDGSFIRLILADGTTFSGPSRVLDLILDGNLGTSFLETHDVTIDLPHKTGWVKPFVAKAR
jgi:hypothetical protein